MQYASAVAAPAWTEDTNALWLFRYAEPNASISWAVSEPGGSMEEEVGPSHLAG